MAAGDKISRRAGRAAPAPQADGQISAAIDDFTLIDAPGHLLRRNHQRSYEIFSQLVGDDVTRQQISLLLVLAKNPGASQSDLVGKTAIDKSTLKEMLGRLIDRGWVQRMKHEHDSRAWALWITPAGLGLLEERLPLVNAAQQEILAPLPAELQPIFLRCLRILAGLESVGVSPLTDPIAGEAQSTS